MAALLANARRSRAGKAALALVLRLAALAVLLGPARADSVSRVNPDLAALAQLALVSLPPPPSWDSAAPAGLWSVEEFSAEFGKSTDKLPQINHGQASFVRPSHKWLVAFSGWFQRALKSLKLTYKDQTWDCDNYSQCFVAFADLVALKGGEARGSICVGWATVSNLRTFGEIPGTDQGGHAIVVVGSADGIFVIEPQSGKIAALRDYPNRDGFEEVNL